MALGGPWDTAPSDSPCNCFRPWWSVAPPPPCPFHGATYTNDTLTVTTTNTTTSAAVCPDCARPAPHEGGLLAVVDEWFHRHHRIPWWVSRPLCNWRDRRIVRSAEHALGEAA